MPQTVEVLLVTGPDDASNTASCLVVPVCDLLDPALTSQPSVLVSPVPITATNHHGAAEDPEYLELVAGSTRRYSNSWTPGLLATDELVVHVVVLEVVATGT